MQKIMIFFVLNLRTVPTVMIYFVLNLRTVPTVMILVLRFNTKNIITVEQF
jgi:hypothetical protein